MSKLFWLLMAAAKGGFRYLRAVLRVAISMTAKPTTAPGINLEANESVPLPELTAKAEAQPVRNAATTIHAEAATLTANAKAELISDAELQSQAGTAIIKSTAETVPAAVAKMAKTFTVAFKCAAEAVTNVIAKTAQTVTIGLKSAAENVPAIIARAKNGVDACELTANPAQVPPKALRAADGIDVDMKAEPSTVVPVGLDPFEGGPEILLTASPVVWCPPERVDEKTLYVRWVHTIERDGDTLILH